MRFLSRVLACGAMFSAALSSEIVAQSSDEKAGRLMAFVLPLNSEAAAASSYGVANIEALVEGLMKSADPACVQSSELTRQRFQAFATEIFLTSAQEFQKRTVAAMQPTLAYDHVVLSIGVQLMEEGTILLKQPAIQRLMPMFRNYREAEFVDGVFGWILQHAALTKAKLDGDYFVTTGNARIEKLCSDLDDKFEASVKENPSEPLIRKFEKIDAAVQNGIAQTMSWGSTRVLDRLPKLSAQLERSCVRK